MDKILRPTGGFCGRYAVSVIGVRSAVIELRHREKPLQFRLFPMVHYGKPAFCRQVATRLRDCASSMGLAYLAATRFTGQGGARALVYHSVPPELSLSNT